MIHPQHNPPRSVFRAIEIVMATMTLMMMENERIKKGARCDVKYHSFIIFYYRSRALFPLCYPLGQPIGGATLNPCLYCCIVCCRGLIATWTSFNCQTSTKKNEIKHANTLTHNHICSKRLASHTQEVKCYMLVVAYALSTGQVNTSCKEPSSSMLPKRSPPFCFGLAFAKNPTFSFSFIAHHSPVSACFPNTQTDTVWISV